MKIQELWTDEFRWTKGALARDKAGGVVHAGSPEAVCWCLVGAIIKCELSDNEEVHGKINRKLSEKGYRSRIIFNDNSTFEDVKALVDELDI